MATCREASSVAGGGGAGASPERALDDVRKSPPGAMALHPDAALAQRLGMRVKALHVLQMGLPRRQYWMAR